MKKLLMLVIALVLISQSLLAQNNALSFTPAQFASLSTGTVVTTLTNNYTFECWVKWDGTNAASDKYIFYNGNTSSSGQSLYIKANTQNIHILYGGVIDFNTGVTLSANAVTHLALVRNAGTSTLYVNGAAAGSTTIAAPSVPSGGFSLGYWNGFSANVSFPGQIDLFRIWSTPLSAATISTWMGQEIITAHPNFGNLIANFPLNEGTGQSSASVGGSAAPVSLVLGLNTTAADANDPTWVSSVFPAPTLTEWGMIFFAASLLGIALWKLPSTQVRKA